MNSPAIFTLPKPFTDDHIATIQFNAIKSWTLSNADSDIFLLGDEAGIKEVSDELRVQHLQHIAYNNHGTPLLNSAFQIAAQHTNARDMVYTNADMIYLQAFGNITNKLPLSSFLIIGRRTDLDISKRLKFSNGWQEELEDSISREGKLHATCGIDYFVFQKETWKDFPPFVVGRAGWDNGFIYLAKRKEFRSSTRLKGLLQSTRIMPILRPRCSKASGTDQKRKRISALSVDANIS